MREFRRFQFASSRRETGHALFLGASQETFGTPHISRNERVESKVQASGWENPSRRTSSMANNQSGQSNQSGQQDQSGQQQKRQDQRLSGQQSGQQQRQQGSQSGQQDKNHQQNPGRQNMSGQQNKPQR
jgi:hypothetical protein